VFSNRQTCQHFRKPLLHCLIERKDDLVRLILGEVSSLQDQNDKDRAAKGLDTNAVVLYCIRDPDRRRFKTLIDFYKGNNIKLTRDQYHDWLVEAGPLWHQVPPFDMLKTIMSIYPGGSLK
jgi:hypothetical protein